MTSQINAVGNISTWLYDAAGRNTTQIDALGNIKTTTFDALDRPVTVQYANGTAVTTQYDVASQRTTLLDANGVTRKYQYDAAGQLTTQIDYNSTLTPIITIVDTYDPVGNRTQHIELHEFCDPLQCYDLCDQIDGAAFAFRYINLSHFFCQ